MSKIPNEHIQELIDYNEIRRIEKQLCSCCDAHKADHSCCGAHKADHSCCDAHKAKPSCGDAQKASVQASLDAWARKQDKEQAIALVELILDALKQMKV
jgi:hypothetical protein